MYGVKGSWVGQTFALARGNESEGRKSRIRRSKEERKAMVESFIQKHQKLNNGSFPSLNLTHKEVGGSFYTVREIVRDIIQENRVLGPAKFAEENESSQQLEKELLGSIAPADQYPLTISSNGFKSIETEFRSGYEELSTASDRRHATPEEHQVLENGKFINGMLDRKDEGLSEQIDEQTQCLEVVEAGKNDKDYSEKDNNMASDGDYDFPESETVINGSLVDAMAKESQDVTQVGLQVDTESEVKNVEVESLASDLKVTTIIGDFEVETFPVRPAGTVNDLKGLCSESKDKDHNFAESDTEKELAVVGSYMTNEVDVSPSSIVVGKNEDNETTTDSSSELISTKVISEQSDTITGAKVVGASNSMKVKYADCNGGTNGTLKTEKEVGLQQNGSPQKESSPTLDRINLESWDGASEKPRRSQDNNPLWSVFKAFVDAIVKFWSE